MEYTQYIFQSDKRKISSAEKKKWVDLESPILGDPNSER